MIRIAEGQKMTSHKGKRHVIPHYATRAEYEADTSFRNMPTKTKLECIMYSLLVALWVSVILAMMIGKLG